MAIINRIPKGIPALANAGSFYGHMAALLAATVVLIVFGHSKEWRPSTPWLFVFTAAPCVVLIGTRLRAAGNMLHECCHGIFFIQRQRNWMFGQFLGVFLFQPFESYCRDHRTHHKHLAHPRKDLDLARYQGALPADGVANIFVSQLRLALGWPCLRMGFKPQLWCSEDPAFANLARCAWLAFLLTGLSLLVGFGFGLSAVMIILGSCGLYPVLCVWSDIADHALPMGHLGQTVMPKDHARNHVFSWSWLNWLLLPRSDAYHLVHHMHPDLPTIHLAAEHQRLCDTQPDYRKLDHELRIFG
jgi:fatty acid desaturase